jgi:hypothetical protein
MRPKANQTSAAGGVQVFELTMDNPEDQDELNRRFRKPGEADRSPSAKTRRTNQSQSPTGLTRKTKRKAKGTS